MLCKNSEAMTFARCLVGNYPNSTISDPEFYLGQLVTIFLGHEHDIVEKAVLPYGIPSQFPTFLPTTGEVVNYLRERGGASAFEKTGYDAAQERIALTRALIHDPILSEQDRERRRKLAQAWLDHSAELRAGPHSRPAKTDEEREALLEDARQVGASIRGMKLSEEAQKLWRDQNDGQAGGNS